MNIVQRILLFAVFTQIAYAPHLVAKEIDPLFIVGATGVGLVVGAGAGFVMHKAEERILNAFRQGVQEATSKRELSLSLSVEGSVGRDLCFKDFVTVSEEHEKTILGAIDKVKEQRKKAAPAAIVSCSVAGAFLGCIFALFVEGE